MGLGPNGSGNGGIRRGLRVLSPYRTLWVPSLLLASVATFGLASAETRIEPRIEVGVAYTDNARGVSGGGEESDTFGFVSPGVNISAQGARSTLLLDYEFVAERYFGTDNVDTESQSATAFGQTELARDFLFLEGQASLRRDQLSNSGDLSATSDDGNSSDVLDYNIGPVMVFGYGSWLEAETRYTFSESRFDVFGDDSALTDAPADVQTHTVSQQWRTGSRFDRYSARFTSRYSNSKREDIPDLERSLLLLENELAVARPVDLLFSVGYENIEDGTTAGEDLDGLILTGGVRWTPGPKLTLEVQAGQRFDDDFASASLQYNFDLNTRLIASYDTQVSTSQTGNQRTLGFVQVGPGGGLIDTRTGLPFTGAGRNSDLTEQDNLFREKVAVLEFVAERRRNAYFISAFHTERDTEISGRDETSTGVDLRYSRQLSSSLSMQASAGYANLQDTEDTDAELYNAGVSVSYSLSPTFIGTLSYDYQERVSDDANDDFQENLVALRLRKTF